MMKKVLIALAVLASMQVAEAQVNPNAAAKAVETAKEAAANPKKAAKVTTWTKLAEAYVAAYDAPAGKVWLGASTTEVDLAMAGEKPLATENVVLGGAPYTKQVYADKNLYFNANGQLNIIEVTKPVVDKPLEKALEAYGKAFEVDNGSKTKEIAAGLKGLNEKFANEAFNAFNLGDLKAAENYFSLAQKTMATEPLSQVDTSSLYNSGFIAQQLGEFEQAKSVFEECLKIGYYAEGGDVYSKIADCVTHIDTSAAGRALAKNYLEEGFQKFPGSQAILIGLINYYVSSGDNTDRLFELLDGAKKNEPNNASLYYVEGNIHVKLGNIDKAVEAYEKCATVSPEYEYGYIGEGVLYYNQALELQTKAQSELDDAKYVALVQDFEKTLKMCIEPFEKAFEITKDEAVKSSIAEYLKNAYYRFRDQDASFQAGYEKYDAYLRK